MGQGTVDMDTCHGNGNKGWIGTKKNQSYAYSQTIAQKQSKMGKHSETVPSFEFIS